MNKQKNLPEKLLAIGLLTMGFVAGFLLFETSSSQNLSRSALAYDNPSLPSPGECGSGNGYYCPFGRTCSCPEWTFNWEDNVDAGDCTCVTPPENQVGCLHTICPVGHYCYNPGNGEATYCLPNPGTTGTPGEPTLPPGATATPTPAPTGQCLDVKAYTPSWVAHSSGTLSQLNTGSELYFCVRGSTNLGNFTKGQFTINSTQRPETTTARPGSTNEFCDLYQIPENTYSFSITGKIYHSTLGWIQ